MNFSRNSLVGALNRRLLLSLSLLWLAGAGASLWQAAHEIEKTMDGAMVQTARLLIALASEGLEDEEAHEVVEEARELAEEIPSPGGENELGFQLLTSQGRLLVASNAPNTRLDLPLRHGFSDRDGYRVYVEFSEDGNLVLLMLDRLSDRRETLLELLMFLLLPLGMMLPLAAWMVMTRVQSGLEPVGKLGEDIAARDGRHLEPLVSRSIPDELQPLVSSVNRLMSRLNTAIEGERQFAATSAHELRTPVASALAQIQRLRSETRLPENDERALQVQKSLEGMARLVERLLQLARADAGIAMVQETNDILPAARIVTDELVRLPGMDQRLEVKGLDREHLFWKIDIDAFAILLRNLIENAQRHGDKKGMIKVNLSESGLSVVNDCAPLTEADLRRLKGRFERASRSQEGFGLGLAIVDSIVRQAEGELVLSSPAPGQARGFAAIVRWKVVEGGP